MKPTTLTAMRESAQSAKKFDEGPALEYVDEIYTKGSANYKCFSRPGETCNFFVDGARWQHENTKLADAVTQLCDEVERLRTALNNIRTNSSHPRLPFNFADQALKESNERFGE